MSKLLFTVLFLGLLLTSVDLIAAIRPAPAVGAPLDGGLLTILAGAGIAYFAARKKKRNSEE